MGWMVDDSKGLKRAKTWLEKRMSLELSEQ